MIETHEVADKICSVEHHHDVTKTQDLLAHPVVIHVSNVAKKGIWLASVQTLKTIQDLLAHRVVIHASNVAKKGIWLESVLTLQAIQDLLVHLAAAHVSNVVRKDIRREIVLMPTSVDRAVIKENVEVSVVMAIAGVTVETIEAAVEEGMD